MSIFTIARPTNERNLHKRPKITVKEKVRMNFWCSFVVARTPKFLLFRLTQRCVKMSIYAWRNLSRTANNDMLVFKCHWIFLFCFSKKRRRKNCNFGGERAFKWQFISIEFRYIDITFFYSLIEKNVCLFVVQSDANWIQIEWISNRSRFYHRIIFIFVCLCGWSNQRA